MVNGKELRGKWSWFMLGYYSVNHLELRSEAMKIFTYRLRVGFVGPSVRMFH
jgi:hypothetical protein